jgi:cytochrome b561
MKSIKIIFIFLFIALLISEGLLYAQPKPGAKTIPSSIISEVRVQIEKLRSYNTDFHRTISVIIISVCIW